MTTLVSPYRNEKVICPHDPATWNFNRVRGHDPRTGYVTYYLEMLCSVCYVRRQELRKLSGRRVVGEI